MRAAVAAGFCIAGDNVLPAYGQEISPDLLQRALENRAAVGQPDAPPLQPNLQVFQPVIPNQMVQAPPSRLETLYSQRAGRPLTQFGYAFLGVPSAVAVGQAGAVQDNYILGVGDEIVVVLRGQENATYRQRVNRDGQVIVPRLPPLPASGRSFGEFRDDLEAQVGQAYVATNAFTSLGEIRQIAILVTGEVQSPGLRTLNALATPLDALLLSGGVKKTGSLRNVALVRGNTTATVDLYSWPRPTAPLSGLFAKETGSTCRRSETRWQ
jgi:protein involved in polysaccharide export with SLBB domain